MLLNQSHQNCCGVGGSTPLPYDDERNGRDPSVRPSTASLSKPLPISKKVTIATVAVSSELSKVYLK